MNPTIPTTSTRLDTTIRNFRTAHSDPAAPDVVCPTLIFTHAGRERVLNKHASVQQALRASTMTIADALKKPWYLRTEIGGRERVFSCRTAKDADAIRAAKDILNGRIQQPSQFAAFLAARDAKRGLTLGTLAEAWLAAGLPFSKTKPRDPAAAATLRETLQRALPWWTTKVASAVTHATIEDFVCWRRDNVRAGLRFTGSRSADLQLGALSCLCQWAVLTGQLDKNPFETRERYATKVKHCHDSMPAHDEQFHQVLGWMFTGDIERITCGAYLAFSALSGLRPGEPIFLQRVKTNRHFPADFRSAVPGQIYRLPDSTWRMKVQRLKNGQNPAILITPALRAFLHHWTAWLRRHAPTATMLFPGATEDRCRDYLERASRELGVPAMKPHGFGRAYYVRVRRSQGADDLTIAVELGQTTNGKLIRDTYGDPRDPVGGNLHDWQPKQGPCAWEILSVSKPVSSSREAKISQ